MLVFGDLELIENPRDALDDVSARWSRALDLPAGLARHDALGNAYMDASRIAQGCVDHEFAQRGSDALTPLHEAALQALRGCADALAQSWGGAPVTASRDPFAPLRALAPDAPAATRTPEGFAFYALFPEACLELARPDEETCVVGVRSIGMALAPLVAQRFQARLVVTLRPTGHPFQRRCALDRTLEDEVKRLRHMRFVIVDEGPGLSGSSFGAVADALESLGVGRERITFCPSHDGAPGPMASAAHRQRWSLARKRPLTLEGLPERLSDWLRDLIGEPVAPARDLSGGLWRDAGSPTPHAPANRPFERRKFLVETRQGRFLAKFTGLGSIGIDKAGMARALAQAGFGPPVVGLRRGFLVERWIEGASLAAAPRAQALRRIASYVAFRASNLPAPRFARTDLAGLLNMARFNVAQALGEASAAGLDRWSPRLADLQAMERPAATDNRMHAWEWLAAPGGAILKTDAVDHHAAHDLIGARDPAWDVAGAMVEFDMSEEERQAFIESLRAQGLERTREFLRFHLDAYCAFQLGAAHMAADANASWPEDAARWRAEGARYARWLQES